MVEHRQRMLPSRSGSAAGAAGSCKLILPPKGKKPARKKESFSLCLYQSLLKTKSLNLPFAAWLHGVFGAAASLGKKEGCHQDCKNFCVSEREM